MGILSSYLGIESLGLFLGFRHPFMIGNHDFFFKFLDPVGKSCLTTSGGKSQDYCGNGKSLHLVRTFIIFLKFSLYCYCLHNTIYLLIFVVYNRPKLENQYRD